MQVEALLGGHILLLGRQELNGTLEVSDMKMMNQGTGDI